MLVEQSRYKWIDVVDSPTRPGSIDKGKPKRPKLEEPVLLKVDRFDPDSGRATKHLPPTIVVSDEEGVDSTNRDRNMEHLEMMPGRSRRRTIIEQLMHKQPKHKRAQPQREAAKPRTKLTTGQTKVALKPFMMKFSGFAHRSAPASSDYQGL